jgi:hypothetical protein
VSCLRADRATYLKHCGGGRSKDFAMWLALQRRAPFGRHRKLVSSVPGLSTHVHLPWISPNPEIDALLERMRSTSG